MLAAEILATPPPTLKACDAAELAERHFGLEATASSIASERDQNFKLLCADGRQYLLKVANAAEDENAIHFENAALAHIASVAPDFPVPRVVPTTDGEDLLLLRRNGSTHWVRVITWLSGNTLRDVAPTEPLRRQLGATLAELGKALRGLFHSGGGKQLLWDIRHTASLANWLEHLEDKATREACADVIANFDARVLQRLTALRSQVVHNDLNASNVLVSDDQHPRVTGIIDFGDMVHAPLVCDVAIGAKYQLLTGDDPLDGAIQFVEAYHQITPLESDEVNLLFDLICARLATTLVITGWRASRYPENRDYILRNAHVAADQLCALREIGRAEVTKRFARVCPLIPPPSPAPAFGDPDAMLQRRRELLGSAYRLFYERPLHAVRGQGVWLYDAAGKAYLDAYNNVPLVGHCHPKVLRAMCDQAATLNTHTRYLHDKVLDYAEQLLAEFPPELDRVMFGCTGSEANELALRLARAYTGNDGVIVSEHAYHGNTTAISQLSPSYQSPDARADWVETVAPPNGYRCAAGSDDEGVSKEFLGNLEAAIARLESRGIRPAALLLDAGFTSDGMFIAPPDCLASAARKIRAAGGVYIADEVQAGFARFGKTMWGFELHDLVPDIVTLGKPIGNGHPLSATIVRQEILDEFASRGRYFNTFGGNPVSAAVGLAVLEVFREEGLARNSLAVGEYLHTQLDEVRHEFEAVAADIRGAGLFAGVELVNDPVSKRPAADKTRKVVNYMRERGVLISLIGPNNNVLKVRPPLPFQRKHVDQLIDSLREAMK